MSSPPRGGAVRLVVNADDLGYDPEIDRGILEAHRRGLVTSASAMVDTPFAATALREAPPSLGVGLHAVLDPGLGAGAAQAEIERQLVLFERLRGRAPTHLDTHRHAHAAPAVLEALARVAGPRRVPARALDAAMRARLREAGVATADGFLGDAAARPCWTLERLLAALASLGEGTTELMCHPGYRPSAARTSFGAEREVELRALCDPRALEAARAAGLSLVSFSGR
jgi:predicted glycoside hydrolase/deacetylase ChbG (UPF0249 family)